MIARTCLALASILGTLACQSAGEPDAIAEPQDDEATRASEIPDQANLSLLRPIGGARIRQNDPTIGCDVHLHRGYGFRIRFDWTDAPGDIAGYQLHVQNRHAQFPILDVHTRISEYDGLWCNSFVIDRNLENWDWRVRTLLADGSSGEWTPRATFRFSPCRLKNGHPCNAPPENP